MLKLKVKTVTPKIRVSDVEYNQGLVLDEIQSAQKEKVDILVFPELTLVGASIGSLLEFKVIEEKTRIAIEKIKNSSKDILCFVGTPLYVEDEILNVQFVFYNQEIIGIYIYKKGFQFYNNNKQHFDIKKIKKASKYKVLDKNFEITIRKQKFNVGIAERENNKIINLKSIYAADVVVAPNAHLEKLGDRDLYNQYLIRLSEKCNNLILVAANGPNESTAEGLFCGDNKIINKGQLIEEKPYFENSLSYSFNLDNRKNKKKTIAIQEIEKKLYIDPTYPFIPDDKYLDEIITMQMLALKRRVEHTASQTLVLGLSGGVDSVWALIIVREMIFRFNLKTKLQAITMPCFGTSQRTKKNAELLCSYFGIDLLEIDIRKAVTETLKNIGHDLKTEDVTFQNTQARERTQILMNYANKNRGLVIGTGDLSECLLGWATYNGDHMSSYAINASLPKTLLQRLIIYYAEKSSDKIKSVLYDVVDTPISPELELLDSQGKIKQKTEDIIGPYKLHDYFIYYTLFKNKTPKELFKQAMQDFNNQYNKSEIIKCLEIFYSRFIKQQFKRSCFPDAPCVNILSISPRFGFAFPSDVCNSFILNDINNLEK